VFAPRRAAADIRPPSVEDLPTHSRFVAIRPVLIDPYVLVYCNTAVAHRSDRRRCPHSDSRHSRGGDVCGYWDSVACRKRHTHNSHTSASPAVNTGRHVVQSVHDGDFLRVASGRRQRDRHRRSPVRGSTTSCPPVDRRSSVPAVVAENLPAQRVVEVAIRQLGFCQTPLVPGKRDCGECPKSSSGPTRICHGEWGYPPSSIGVELRPYSCAHVPPKRRFDSPPALRRRGSRSVPHHRLRHG
jgi:hypothetical protein